MNVQPSLTTQAHAIISDYVTGNVIAIDATLGNGHDTLFLAKKIGTQGSLFGFDTQQKAVDSTRCRLENEELTDNIILYTLSHDQMATCIPEHFHGKVKVIMFNLGYLPGSDKSIITQVDTTLSALQQSITLLASPGILTIMAYPGHAGGDIETQQITHWCQQLNAEYFDCQMIINAEKETAPRLFVIKKLAAFDC